MKKLLLLYDITEKDLARDICDFLIELRIGDVERIPLSPNSSGTLAEKEKRHFEGKDAAIFVLTPGSERMGVKYPSPSVNHEMGQATQKFDPSKVIYLVEKECNVPAIDQKPYIQFDKSNARSVIEALTSVVRDLTNMGLYPPNLKQDGQPEKRSEKPSVQLTRDEVKSLSDSLKNALELISSQHNSSISDMQFVKHMVELKGQTIQGCNFIKSDLQNKGWMTAFGSYLYLTAAGLEVARTLVQIKTDGTSGTMAFLARRKPQGR